MPAGCRQGLTMSCMCSTRTSFTRGRHRAAVDELIADHAHAGDRPVVALAEDLDRRGEEAQLDAPLLARRLALGVVAQHLEVALGAGVELRVVDLLERIDLDVRARH